MRIGLFTTEQVCELCGISPKELKYWDKAGFLKPRYVEGVKRPSNRLFSFRDVVNLRARRQIASAVNREQQFSAESRVSSRNPAAAWPCSTPNPANAKDRAYRPAAGRRDCAASLAPAPPHSFERRASSSPPIPWAGSDRLAPNVSIWRAVPECFISRTIK